LEYNIPNSFTLFQIGFNGGNGTQSFEYKPYSQDSVLRDLVGRGWTNGFPGRHIFRIDEKIMVGNCNKDLGVLVLLLSFALVPDVLHLWC
jgi:hypothetical protein